jgi:hypothetical protein
LSPIQELTAAAYGPLIADLRRLFSYHASLATHRCPNQSLAKQNRKPMQSIEHNDSDPSQSLVFVAFFAAGNAATSRCNITSLRLAGQCHDDGQGASKVRARCELDEAAAFRYRSRFC